MDKDDEIYSEQIYGYTEIDNVEPLYVTDHIPGYTSPVSWERRLRIKPWWRRLLRL